MFHVPSDYVTQQARHSRIRNGVADQQLSGTIPAQPKQISPTFHTHTRREVTEFENAEGKRAPISIDFPNS